MKLSSWVRVILACAIVEIAARVGAQAEIALMPRTTLIREADFIGIIRVVEVKMRAGTERSQSWSSGLAQEAVASVVEIIKGTEPEKSLRIAFDNGLSCPNVTYSNHATYLVFLKRVEKSPYETINHEQGRMPVIAGRVPDWHAGDGKGTPVSEVVAELRRQLAQPSKHTTHNTPLNPTVSSVTPPAKCGNRRAARPAG